MAHDVFISYSNKDKPVADAICSSLEKDDICCWIAPRDIMPGATWGEAIIKAITISKVMVVVLSGNSNESIQVLREVERAVAKNVIIIPFRIEDILPSAAMEYYISSEHWLDAFTPPLQAHIQKLTTTLQSLFNRAEVPQAALPRHNLPRQLTRLVGRDQEISQVSELLHSSALVTLTGSGGVGKTRLSLAVAEKVAAEFPDGVWFIELAPLSDPELVAQTIANTLGLSADSTRPVLAVLSDFLCERKALLLLDNCEHLIEACAVLAKILLNAAPDLKLLASSRETLGLPGETTFRVPSLPLPPSEQMPTVDDLMDYEAIALFAERAQAVLPEFSITSENAAYVVQICKRLDGIPLALELAAARIASLDVAQIAARLDHAFRLLASGSRAVLERQRTLRAAIDWSYGLLSEPERQLLKRLSVFSGGAFLEAIEAVCSGSGLETEEILDWLSQLVSKSMLQVERKAGSTPRYRMLEMVRQYVQEKLLESGETEQYQDRHLHFLLDLAEKAEPELRGQHQLDWIDRLDAEIDNLRSALGWSQQHDAEACLRLASALWRFWDYRGYYLEGDSWFKKALELNEGLPSSVRAKALTRSGNLLRNMYVSQESLQLAQAAVALSEELGDESALAMALTLQSDMANIEGIDSLFWASSQKGLELCLKLSDHWGASSILGDLSEAWIRRNNLEQSRACAEESVREARLSGDVRRIGFGLSCVGHVTLLQGDTARSYEFYQESVALAYKMKDKLAIYARSFDLAIWALHVEDYARAEELASLSVQIARGLGSPLNVGWGLVLLGVVSFAEGNIALSSSSFAEVLEIAAQKGSVDLTGIGSYYLGELAREQGNWDQARTHFSEAINKFASADSYGRQLCLAGFASLAFEQDQLINAVRLYGAHDKLGTPAPILNFPFRQRRKQRHLETARARLDDEVYSAAWAEGLALSIEQIVLAG